MFAEELCASLGIGDVVDQEQRVGITEDARFSFELEFAGALVSLQEQCLVEKFEHGPHAFGKRLESQHACLSEAVVVGMFGVREILGLVCFVVLVLAHVEDVVQVNDCRDEFLEGYFLRADLL